MKRKISIIAILAIIALLLSSTFVFADLEDDLEQSGTLLVQEAPKTEVEENEILGTNEIKSLVATNLISSKNIKDEDVYMASEKIELKDESVNGNVYLAGKDIVIENEVIYGDLFVAGQRIEIKDTARINGNVFAAGQDLFINGTVDRDLYAAGSTVELGKTSIIGYSGYLAASKIIVKGAVTRNLNVGSEDLKVESTGSVLGNLNYAADKEGEISKEATIGKVNFSKVELKERTTWEIAKAYILDFVKYFVFVMVMLIFAIKFAPDFIERAMKKVTFGSFGLGLCWFIIIPVIFVCLLLLRVTSTLSAVLLLLYITAIILSKAVACIAIGRQIEEAHEKFKLPLGTALVAIISWILFQIPFVGGLISVIFDLLGFGILLRACIVSNGKKEVVEVKE